MTNSKTAIGNFTKKANRGMVMQTKGTTVSCSACDAVHHLYQCLPSVDGTWNEGRTSLNVSIFVITVGVMVTFQIPVQQEEIM